MSIPLAASAVIFFLNDMVEEGILAYEEESGKGGCHGIYYPKMDKVQFAEYVTKVTTDKLHDFSQLI